jgi:hypothetical protein
MCYQLVRLMTKQPVKRWWQLLAAVGLSLPLVACGTSPTSPATAGVPLLDLTGHRVSLLRNEVDFGWPGAGATAYRLTIGSTPNGHDVLATDVAGRGYTFVALRTARTYFARLASTDGNGDSASGPELKFDTVDVRNIFDALVYRAGPMSIGQAQQLGSTPASLWPDGTHLRALVSREAGERVRALVQAAMDTYAELVGGSVTGGAELVEDDMHLVTLDQVPPFTVVVRVIPGFCGATAIGCAFPGPAPIGVNASIVTLRSADVQDSTVVHEMGHVYGLAHISGQKGPLRLMMSPCCGPAELSSGERDAIAFAYQAGLRAGSTRDAALVAGVVLPWSLGDPSMFASLGPPGPLAAGLKGAGTLISCH